MSILKAEKVDHVHNFNMTINELLDTLEKKCSNKIESALVDRARSRLIAARTLAGRDIVICVAGKYMYGYRKYIIDEDIDFAMKFNVKEKFGAIISAQDEFIYSLIEITKQVFVQLSEDEKKQCLQLAKRLLASYASWRLECIEESKSEAARKN